MSSGGEKWRFLVNHCLESVPSVIEVSVGTSPGALFKALRSMNGRFPEEQALEFDIEMWNAEANDWIPVGGDMDRLIKCRKVRVVKATPQAPPPTAALPEARQEESEVSPVQDPSAHVAPADGAVANLPELQQPQQPTEQRGPPPQMPNPVIITYDEVLAACASLPASSTPAQVSDAIISSIREEVDIMARIAKEHGAQVLAPASVPLKEQRQASSGGEGGDRVSRFMVDFVGRHGVQLSALLSKLKLVFPRLFSDREPRDAAIKRAADAGLIVIGAGDKYGQQRVTLGNASGSAQPEESRHPAPTEPDNNNTGGFSDLTRILKGHPEGVLMSMVHPELRKARPSLFSDKEARDDFIDRALADGIVQRTNANTIRHGLVLPSELSTSALLVDLLQRDPRHSVEHYKVASYLKKMRPELFEEKGPRDAAIEAIAGRGKIVLSEMDANGQRMVSLPSSSMPVAAAPVALRPADIVAHAVSKKAPYRVSLLSTTLRTDHPDVFNDEEERSGESKVMDAIAVAKEEGLIRTFEDGDGTQFAELGERSRPQQQIKSNKDTTSNIRPLSSIIKNRSVKAVIKTIEDWGENGVLQHSTVGLKMSKLAYYNDKDRRDGAIKEAIELGFVTRIFKDHGQSDLQITDRRKTGPKRQRSPTRTTTAAAAPIPSGDMVVDGAASLPPLEPTVSVPLPQINLPDLSTLIPAEQPALPQMPQMPQPPAAAAEPEESLPVAMPRFERPPGSVLPPEL